MTYRASATASSAGLGDDTLSGTATAAGDSTDWDAMRAPPGEGEREILDRTFKWLATLPAQVRPIATGHRYPRIVNRLCDLWPSCEYTRLYFQSLLVDRRRGRRGFAPGVRRELEALQHYYFVHLSGLPAVLWNAVPLRPPRIPHRVFPRLAETDEIDIPPL